ncbi:hypothetical protein Hte_011796 [Hypoxylon texense]
MDLEVLVSEAESITTSTPLNLIIELFKEISMRHASRFNRSLVKRLQSSRIFPIDEGNKASGFDDLCSGLEESEWYIADRPQYRDGFRGVLSLLSFSPWDILTMMPLIKLLDFENRLLSKRAVWNTKIPSYVLDQKQTELFQEKSKFIARQIRMMPKSLAQRKQILKALNTMEVFIADDIFVQWMITSTDSRLTGREIKNEEYKRTQAAIFPPTKENGIRLYLSPDSVSCPPFEIATQLADMCGIEELANLVYIVISQPSTSNIEQYLDQQDPSKDSNGNRDNGFNEAEDFDLGAADKEDAMENAIIHFENIPGNNQEMEQLVAFSGRNEAPETRTEMVEGAQSDVALNDTGTNIYSYPPLANKPEELRPGYASLEDHFGNPPAAVLRPNQGELTSSAEAEAEFHPLTVLARPRIVGKPHVTFVSDPLELPREDLSGNATGGKIFPGRAQISESGSCAIVLATSPGAGSDPDVSFAGELFVLNTQKHHSLHVVVLANMNHSGFQAPRTAPGNGISP